MSKTNGSNGNGAPVGVNSFASRTDADGKVELRELVELSVLTMFFIQKLGKVTNSDILAKMEEIGAVVNRHLLAQAAEALQARGLISYASGRIPSGDVERHWKPKRIVWAAPPEVAHIKDLLPTLVQTTEAKELIDELNGRESDGDGEKKAKSRLGYDEYIDVKATFLTLDELLGSQPTSPWLESLVKKSKHTCVEADIRFWRDEATGGIRLCSDALRGWLRTGMRAAGFGESAADYISVSDAIIHPQRKMVQIALPVIDPRTGAGCGLNTYEALQPKERFTVTFRIPTRGIMSARQFKLFLATYAPRPIRGMSPARGARFGKCVLIAYEELGRTSDAVVGLRSAMEVVPPEAMAFYEAMMSEAAGVDLRKGRDAGFS